MEWQKDDYTISTNKEKLNIPYVYQYLSVESYWAQQIPLEVVEKAIANSVCFGVYHKDQQIGFARMVTDDATFGYLADVFIDENYRGQGLSKWLVKIIMDYPPFQKFRRIMLATRDAQGLYKKFGFTHPADLKEIMYVRRPDIYKKS